MSQEMQSVFIMSWSENVERALTDVNGQQLMVFTSGYSKFSNFNWSVFKSDRRTYTSVQQFYESEKAVYFGDYAMAEQICNNHRPSVCYNMAKNIRNFDPNMWQLVAPNVMLAGLNYKFRQNQEAQRKLLATGKATIVAASKYDKYWCNGLDIEDEGQRDPRMWKGSNQLGQLLMNVREMLYGVGCVDK